MFDWEKAFSNTSVDEKVAIFNRTIFRTVISKAEKHEKNTKSIDVEELWACRVKTNFRIKKYG